MKPNPSKKQSASLSKSWFDLLSSMKFAVALLSVLGIASVIGTLIPQNRSAQDYAFAFGPFWSRIFDTLGLYDVYSSSWFVVIMIFLTLSTFLCLCRHTPIFIRQMRSFRENVTARSLSRLTYSQEIPGNLSPEIATRYLNAQNFNVKTVQTDDGVLLAAKKGSLNKLGYIFTHAALIVICLGGLIDSNMYLKAMVYFGKIVPDTNSVYISDFPPESRTSARMLSFRGDTTLPEGKSTDIIFVPADKQGMVLQELPYIIELKKFDVDYYDNGMPKDFASDLILHDKSSDETLSATIRVNHPLTYKGTTIYQASFDDGGSALEFDTWLLPLAATSPNTMKAKSMETQTMTLDHQNYDFIFERLKPVNIENAAPINTNQSLKETLASLQTIKSDGKTQNVGPTVSYKIKDGTGQITDYMTYMLPQEQNNMWYYFFGSKSPFDDDFKWVAVPMDNQQTVNTFMLLRSAFLNPKMREKVALQIAEDVNKKHAQNFIFIVNNTLSLFARGGHEAIDHFIKTQIPESERQQMGSVFYQVLASASKTLLDQALMDANLPQWADSKEKANFLLESLQAYTALNHYPFPLLLQLKGYEETRASGLQITRSPGKVLVYSGSLLLVLGIIFMFYVREKRAWLLFEAHHTRFAMASNRFKRDFTTEFPEHIANLTVLAKDNTDENHHE